MAIQFTGPLSRPRLNRFRQRRPVAPSLYKAPRDTNSVHFSSATNTTTINMSQPPSLTQMTWFLCDARYKYSAYLFLNRPRTFLAIAYQIAMILLLMAMFIMTMIFTRFDYPGYKVLFFFDLAMLIILFLEFCIRFWASTVLPKYRGWKGMLRLVTSPWYWLDIAVIAITITCMVYDARESILSVLLRGFRILHFFEIRYQLWRLFSSAIWIQRFQLMVCLYLCLVILFIIGFIIYYVEVKHNPNINTVAEAIWFMLVTFTTVGYGDIVPVTTAGKIITGLFMVIGVSIFCLPAGVLGASLALKIDEEEANRSNTFRQNHAAMLIQDAWRVYWVLEKMYKRPPLPPSTNYVIDIRQPPKAPPPMRMPNEPLIEQETLINIYAVQFVYLLKFFRTKRQFKLSNFLSDNFTFYETYTTDIMAINELARNIDIKMNRVEETLMDETSRLHDIQSILRAELAAEVTRALLERFDEKVENLQLTSEVTCKCWCMKRTRWLLRDRRRLQRLKKAVAKRRFQVNDQGGEEGEGEGDGGGEIEEEQDVIPMEVDGGVGGGDHNNEDFPSPPASVRSSAHSMSQHSQPASHYTHPSSRKLSEQSAASFVSSHHTHPSSRKLSDQSAASFASSNRSSPLISGVSPPPPPPLLHSQVSISSSLSSPTQRSLPSPLVPLHRLESIQMDTLSEHRTSQASIVPQDVEHIVENEI